MVNFQVLKAMELWLCLIGIISVFGEVYTSEVNDVPICPGMCQCDNFITTCRNKNLTELPVGINQNIISLDLSINNFRNISQDLKNFKNLKYLNMSHNKIDTLGHSDFEGLGNLERLDLTFNIFHDWKDIHSEALRRLSKLVFLDMSNNPVRSIPQFSNHFHMSSLEILKLNNCSMMTVSVLVFSEMESLRELHLANNPLRSINGTLTSTSLKYIDLSNCHLNYVEDTAFQGCSVLETISLAKNTNLRKITMNSDSLLYLDMPDSSLERIPRGNLNALINLNVFGNFLRVLKNHSFSNYSNLISLNLSYNAITTIEENAFRGLDNLKIIDLSLNKLSVLSEKTFLPTISLMRLDLSHNYISSLDAITSSSLSVLDASYCEIHNVYKYSLSNLPKLMHLALQRNFMTSLPDGWTGDRLVSINLSGCRIKSINNKTFSQMLRLNKIDLSGNRLSSIYPSFFPPSLMTLRVDDNQWRCDCSELKQTFEWLVQFDESMNGLICDSPERFEGQTWRSACQDEWYPPKKNELYWYSLILIISMTFLLLSVVILRKINDVREKRLRIEEERRRTQEREAREALERMQRRQREYREEASRNAPDPRESQGPPSYNDALLLPRMDSSHPSLAGSLHSLASRGSNYGSNPEVNKKGKIRRKRRRRRSETQLRAPVGDTDDSDNERSPRPLESDF